MGADFKEWKKLHRSSFMEALQAAMNGSWTLFEQIMETVYQETQNISKSGYRYYREDDWIQFCVKGGMSREEGQKDWKLHMRGKGKHKVVKDCV